MTLRTVYIFIFMKNVFITVTIENIQEFYNSLSGDEQRLKNLQ